MVHPPFMQDWIIIASRNCNIAVKCMAEVNTSHLAKMKVATNESCASGENCYQHQHGSQAEAVPAAAVSHVSVIPQSAYCPNSVVLPELRPD